MVSSSDPSIGEETKNVTSMTDIKVYVSLSGDNHRVGSLILHGKEETEIVSFEYHYEWLKNPLRFTLQPSLPLNDITFIPKRYHRIFGAFGDSAPDSWGRRLMQRNEQQRAFSQEILPQFLTESDYLLRVSDFSRMGALRFNLSDSGKFLQTAELGVPKLSEILQIVQINRKLESNEESSSELDFIVNAGSSLGGARPKASVVDDVGRLAIAKFPKGTDNYCVQTWEHIALLIASKAGITVPRHELIKVDELRVFMTWRFDRIKNIRIPFLSAMSMLNAKEGDVGSYPEIVDQICRYGGQAKKCSEELFRRLILNVLISNTDDHLRNHGFLMYDKKGWELSPVYDINPMPRHMNARIMATNISLTDPTCSIELAMEQCELFGLKLKQAQKIAKNVAVAVAQWREIAFNFDRGQTEIDFMSTAFEHNDLATALQW